jgi:hypothetical protein
MGHCHGEKYRNDLMASPRVRPYSWKSSTRGNGGTKREASRSSRCHVRACMPRKRNVKREGPFTCPAIPGNDGVPC